MKGVYLPIKIDDSMVDQKKKRFCSMCYMLTVCIAAHRTVHACGLVCIDEILDYAARNEFRNNRKK